MKWILVVLVGGVAPVQTDLVFEKLSDCLIAEEQLQQTYANAYSALSQRSMMDNDEFDRRRGRHHRRAREEAVRKLANAGTCIPHNGTDQPITSLDQPAPAPQPLSPTPSPSPKP
ncbi:MULTISPECIES: hypothetical protein [Bradyrhizobium]|uniref:Uncharacterized protein n=1 Tax=Bradyrhizobium elkanii TaxID=29448 RepID=A0A4U6S008_BRAEL|nr:MULTISPECIES: hypothetical protein [Bradyrhizobium]MTV14091.1 hypothetical protein [Bradyrhizobium sp. BR2003]TKV80400.1 hypothetical protein FDV58_16650 [Bradyrhizobium elkanii]